MFSPERVQNIKLGDFHSIFKCSFSGPTFTKLGLTFNIFNASLEGNLHKVQKAMEVEWLPRKPWTLVSGQEPAVAK